MKQVQYVNASGQPIEIGSKDSHKPAKKKRTKRGDEERQHHGYAVLGFSPEHLVEAKKAHEHKKSLGEADGDFDQDIYMNGHKPQKARSAPYSIEESAKQCADMVRRIGWLRVTVEEIIK